MKWLLVFAFCLSAHSSFAGGMAPDIVFAAPNVAAPSYTAGPGDIVSGADVWMGLRAYSAAEAAAGTQKMINLRNGTTTETCDIIVAANGGLGITANCSIASNGVTPAVFCAGATCYIVEWYDQSGANYCSGSPCDLPISTAANQPALNLSCLGTLPCADYSGVGGSGTTGVAITSIAPPWSTAGVAERTSHYLTNSQYWPTANTPGTYFNSAAMVNAYLGGGVTIPAVAATDGAWHTQTTVAPSGASAVGVLDVDGTSSSSSAGTLSTFDSPFFPIYTLYGNVTEAGVWPLAFSGANQTAMCNNQYSYWTTSVPC